MQRFMRTFVILVGLSVFIGAPAVQAATFVVDEVSSVATENPGDTFAAGETVTVSVPVNGEIFATGGNVTITKRAGRSVWAAGNIVSIQDGAEYNVFATGNVVTLAGRFGHDVYVAGNSVTIQDGTEIVGDLRVGGKSVVLNGTVGGNVYVGAESFTSAAAITGSVQSDSGRLTFTGGTIGGTLTYTVDKDPQGLDKVTVTGETKRQERAKGESFTYSMKQDQRPTATSWLMGLVGMLLLGAFVILLLPKKLVEVEGLVMAGWTRQFLTGLVTLFLVPLAIIALAMTILGIPLALVLVAMYILFLLLAKITALILIGMWLARRLQGKETTWWIALVAGAVVVSVLELIPGIGSVVKLAVFVGVVIPVLGALTWWWQKQTR